MPTNQQNGDSTWIVVIVIFLVIIVIALDGQ